MIKKLAWNLVAILFVLAMVVVVWILEPKAFWKGVMHLFGRTWAFRDLIRGTFEAIQRGEEDWQSYIMNGLKDMYD